MARRFYMIPAKWIGGKSYASHTQICDLFPRGCGVSSLDKALKGGRLSSLSLTSINISRQQEELGLPESGLVAARLAQQDAAQLGSRFWLVVTADVCSSLSVLDPGSACREL
ncbi:hypothetical protein VTK56DRAFT_5068 [Thermocarpiscus australiensis]